MRILLTSRNFFPNGIIGGAQASMLLLAQALKQRGHQVAVLSVDDHENIDVHEPTGLQEYRLKLRNLYTQKSNSKILKLGWHTLDRFGWLMRQSYNSAIETFRPDVINTNVMAAIGVNYWRCASNFGIPIVHTVHDYYLLCLKSDMRRSDGNCKAPCQLCRSIACRTSRIAAKGVQEVIYVSEHMRKVHQTANIFPDNIGESIIHGSYAISSNAPVKRETEDLIIGYLGRLSPEKGFEKIVEELKDLPRSGWRMIVGGAGDHNYVSKLQNISKDLPIDFLGTVTTEYFFSQVDTVVISSLWNEPAARVVYEAGLHGVMPIVSNRGGLPELVQGGKRGFIYEPNKKGSLSSQLKSIIMNRSELSNKKGAWAGAENEYHPDDVAARTELVYERAVKRQKNGQV